MLEEEKYLYELIKDNSNTSDRRDLEEIREIDYMREGIIDSFGIMAIIALIEEEYQIDLPGEFLVSDQIRTIKMFAEYIKKVRNEL